MRTLYYIIIMTEGKKPYPYYNILLSEYTKNIMSNVIQDITRLRFGNAQV